MQTSLAMIRGYSHEMGHELKPDFEVAIYRNIDVNEDRGPFATQPPQEPALQQLGVEPIGFCPAMLPRYPLGSGGS